MKNKQYANVLVDTQKCHSHVQTVICSRVIIRMEATGLSQKLQDLHLQGRVIKNNVLFYLQKNHKGSTDDQIRSECKNNFAEPEIFGAKELLHDEYLAVLTDQDEAVGKRLETKRKNGPTNSAVDSVIIDLLKSIDAIEACETNFQIIAKDENEIPAYKSEEGHIKSILERLSKAETDISQLKLDYESVSRENKELISENKELRDEMSKMVIHLSGKNDESHTVDNTQDSVLASAPPPSALPLPTIHDPPLPPAPPLTDNIDLTRPPPTFTQPTTAPISDTPSSTVPFPPPTSISDLPSPLVSMSDSPSPALTPSTTSDVLQTISKKRLTKKEIREIQNVRQESTLEATAEAVSKGIPFKQAIDLGKQVGTIKANTFAQVLKQGSSVSGTIPPRGTSSSDPPLPPPGATARVASRSKLSKTAPYRRGNADNTESNMVMKKPTFMKNKCLVISGLRKDASREDCLQYINKTVNRNINVLHIEILAREYSPWLTIAVELNETDYELLSNINLWEKAIRIRDFIGWRFWHGQKPKKLAPHQIKGSVRMSWDKNSRTTL